MRGVRTTSKRSRFGETACTVAISAIVASFIPFVPFVTVVAAATPAASPTITGQPQSASVKFGKVAHFKVEATGSPKPAYQWQVSSDGGPFSDVGPSSSKLSITATTADDESIYRAVVSNPSGTATSASATLTIAPSATSATVKPLVDGLVDKGVQAPYDASQPFPVTPTSELTGYAAAFSGIVLNLTWAQLEPTKAGFDFAPLDADLASVSDYNAANPTHPLKAKLRVWSGFTAPQWVKALDGPPITVPGDANRPVSATLGRYWMADYEQQWTDFQNALAKHYDSNPLLSEVAVSSCNTETDEPFVMTEAGIQALLAAGWTSADQQQCLDGALANYSAWKHTAVDFTFNSFSNVSSTGVRSPGTAVTAAIMEQCASSEITGDSPLCILDNHGLQDSVSTQQALVYGNIDSLWHQFDHDVPVDFQTFSPDVDLCQTIGVGIAYHAQSVEVWPPGPGSSGFQQYSPAQLTAWDEALKAQIQPTCG